MIEYYKKVIEYYKIEAWKWECPVCGCMNEETIDPGESNNINCSDCGSIFEYFNEK